MPDRLHDGDLFKLGEGENACRAEFLNTDGRKAWRIYDRFGRGILLTEDQMLYFLKILGKSLEENGCF